MKEFIEEYGGIIVISIIGFAVMSGLWRIIGMLCEINM